MVESPYTTLYENFGDKNYRPDFGTNNHAWSGGPLTILSEYVCGLKTISAGWKTFQVKPQLGNLEFTEAGNETFAGKVDVKVEKSDEFFSHTINVPKGNKALIFIPSDYKTVKCNGVIVYNQEPQENKLALFDDNATDAIVFGCPKESFIFCNYLAAFHTARLISIQNYKKLAIINISVLEM